MADSKSKRGAADRRLVAGKQTYEASYFARKEGIPIAEVRKLIKEVGNTRAKLTAAVQKRKG